MTTFFKGAIIGLLLCSISIVGYNQTRCNNSISLLFLDQDSVGISNVYVSLEQDKGIYTSNAKGEVFIDSLCLTTYGLNIQQPMFHTKEHIIDLASGKKIFSVFMLPKSMQLDELDIIEHTEEETYNLVQLSGKELDPLSGKPLGEILKKELGVNALNTGAQISKPVINGLHSNRVLVYTNDVRLESQQWGVEHAPEVDPNSIQRIELIKGASSVKYGNDAIGGVILTKAKPLGTHSGLYSELSLAGFSNGRGVNSSVLLEGGIKKLPTLLWRVQGSAKKVGDVHTPRYYMTNTGVEEANISYELQHKTKHFTSNVLYTQFNTNVAILSFSHIGNLTDLEQAFKADKPLKETTFSYDILRPYQQINHELIRLKNTWTYDKLGELRVIYARQYNERKEYDNHSLKDKPGLELNLTSHTLNVEWQHNTYKGFEGELGVHTLYQANTFSGRYFIPNYKRQKAGLYWVEKFEFKTFHFESGVRYDFDQSRVYVNEKGTLKEDSYVYDGIATNFGVSHGLGDEAHLHFNSAYTWRSPSVNELYSDGIHHGSASIEIGDKLLTKETAWSNTLFFDLEKDKVKFQVEGYVNYFDNFIYLQPENDLRLTIRGAFPVFAFHQSRALLSGLNSKLEVQMTKHLSSVTYISLLKAKNITSNTYLPGIPSDRFKESIKYQFSDTKKLFNTYLTVDSEYVLKQWRVNSSQDYLSAPKAYLLFNVWLGTKLAVKDNFITLNLSVENVLNTSYRTYMNRLRYFSDEMGRNMTIHLKIPITIKK